MILKKLEGIPVYGDPSYRDKQCPTESVEAVTFVGWVRREHPDGYGLLLTHIRNEGKRRRWQADRDKAEGMTAGAPDFIVPGNPSFLCELKRQDHTLSSISDDQVRYLNVAARAGSFVSVALGWEAAVRAFQDWRQISYIL